MKRSILTSFLAFAALCGMAQVTFDFSTAHRGPVIGPLHYGIFYEEINHAGDGGLYAELVRNGSMEENSGNPDHWWTIGQATFSISSQNLLNGAQKRAMHLNLTQAGDGTRNIGYWGMDIVQGQTYRASLYLRAADGWTGDVTLTLESFEGTDLGHATLHIDDARAWRKYTAEITATGSYRQGWFAIRGSRAGTLYIDCVSLMPPTFKGRANGMRRDLAEKLAALHPRFMRFPGGCYIEGGNRYQWRHTVGPVEERLGIYNSNWGYPVSNGMGYHEFLQLAEDLGAEPLFVVNVGMGHGWAEDYRHIEGYIQEALDAIEYANGDTTTYWGARRAAAGHPEPFGLRLLEIGNENYNYTSTDNRDQSDHYAERYAQFYTAIKARYPQMTLIGNSDWGSDYPTWRNQYPLEVIDEHFYRSPDWFASMYHKYDNYSRSSNKVYNGEYAVTSDFGTNGTLKAALGEAIYMAGMERNSDVCVMASYAPIFMNENEAQWRPDMLHYNAYASFGTPSYWVQQMMASTVGHQNITWTETGNTVGLLHGSLGLGSWGTAVTYSNIRVTQADGTVVLDHADGVTSPATMYGTAQSFDIDTHDCTIELDAVKHSGDEGFLIAFAQADAGNYAWWNLGGWANGRHGVEQAVNGSKRTLATTDGSIQTNQTYHIRIEREGLTARCYLDGKLVYTATLADEAGQRLFACASLNEAEDTAIVKLINYTGEATTATLRFADATIGGPARIRVMSHADNYAENTMDEPMKVCPREETQQTARTLPPPSLVGREQLPSTAATSSSQIDSTPLPTREGQGGGSAAGGAAAGGATLTYPVPAYSLSVLSIPLSEVSAEQKTVAAAPPAPVLLYDFEDDTFPPLTNPEEGGVAPLTSSPTSSDASTAPLDTNTPAPSLIHSTPSLQGRAGGGSSYYTGTAHGYLDLGNEAAQAIGTLLNGEAYSVSLNLLPGSAGNLDRYCWAWSVSNGTASYAGLINQAGNGNWYFEKVCSGTCKASSNAGLSRGCWHNITVTSDAEAVRLYIDGQLRATAAPNATPLPLHATTEAWLGSSPFAADARMTDTFFDDFAVYDCALTEAQVLTLAEAAAAKSSVCPALLPTVDDAPSSDAVDLIAGGSEVDITALLTNPDFADGNDGWEGTTFSAAPGTVAEHYYKLFDTYQVLPNMPAGRYRLAWQGFYRNGNIANAYLRHSAGAESEAEVYAEVMDNGRWTMANGVPMLSLYDPTMPYTYSPYTYPDNVATAEAAFEAGHYRQQMEFTVTQIADLRIGQRHFTPTVYDWACVDNFRLTYVGNLTDGIEAIDDEMVNGKWLNGKCYDLSGRRVQVTSKGIYIVAGRKVVVR